MTAAEAVGLARLVEGIAPEYGAHVALTGGCLYKNGKRKDVDLVLYRIRQVTSIDVAGLFRAFAAVGIVLRLGQDQTAGNWIYKADYLGASVDFLFPEAKNNNGSSEAAKASALADALADNEDRPF